MAPGRTALRLLLAAVLLNEVVSMNETEGASQIANMSDSRTASDLNDFNTLIEMTTAYTNNFNILNEAVTAYEIESNTSSEMSTSYTNESDNLSEMTTSYMNESDGLSEMTITYEIEPSTPTEMTKQMVDSNLRNEMMTDMNDSDTPSTMTPDTNHQRNVSINFTTKMKLPIMTDSDVPTNLRDSGFARIDSNICTTEGAVEELGNGESYIFTNPNYPSREGLFAPKTCTHSFSMTQATSTAGGRFQVACDQLSVGYSSTTFSYFDGTESKYETAPFTRLIPSGVRMTTVNIRGTFLGAWGRYYRCTVKVVSGCKCGVPTADRIVGGTAATPLKYGWMALVVFDGDVNSFCGGSLISPTFVMTAAHCLQNRAVSSVSIRLGVHDRTTSPSTEVTRASLQNIIHPSWNSVNYDYDYALVKIAAVDLVANPKISPLCLASGNEQYAGTTATVAGWGKTSGNGFLSDVLLEVEVPVITNAACAPTITTGAVISSRTLCAGASGKDSCQFDSGSPLFSETSLQYYEAIGIVSSGPFDCGSATEKAVYARVTDQWLWIMMQISGDTTCTPPT